MRRTVLWWAALVVVTGAALFMRTLDLGNRPFHADESVHAFKLWELHETGRYEYNPDEFHGPTIYYAALPVLAAKRIRDFGDLTEADCRLPLAVMGTLLALTVGLTAGRFGRWSGLAAAILTAISPALVFYSRYFIQETALVLGTAAFLLFWRLHATSGKPLWAALCGAAAGFMVASKETAVVSIASWLAACLIFRDRSGDSVRRPRWRPMALGIACAIIVAWLFLTGMGKNPAAAVGYWTSFTPWMERAHGTDIHRHPWYYHLRLLLWNRHGSGPLWTEGLIVVLAMVGATAAFRRRMPEETFGRRVAVFTLLQILIYAAIPYKTPWCVLTPLLGLTLLAGMGAQTLLQGPRRMPVRILAGLAIAVGLAHLAWQSRLTSFRHYADPRNPYVYAQTVPDALDIRERAEALAKVHPAGRRMTVKVFWEDGYYWPIPWYLRGFPNVGYWHGVPEDADAPLIFASPRFDEELTERLDATHLMNGYVGLRPHVVAQVWVRMDLWERYIMSRQRSRDPEEP